MLSVVTYKWGTKYSDEYVAKLKRAVARHLDIPHKFHVLTYNEPQRPGLGWQKLNIYRNDIGLCGYVLGLDLDLVIREDITDAVLQGFKQLEYAKLVGMRKWKPTKYPLNSSMVLFRAGELAYLYDGLDREYVRDEHSNEEKYVFQVMASHGDLIDYWPEGVIHSWRRGYPVEQTKIVSFNGKQKQHELTHLPVVSENWI